MLSLIITIFILVIVLGLLIWAATLLAQVGIPQPIITILQILLILIFVVYLLHVAGLIGPLRVP